MTSTDPTDERDSVERTHTHIGRDDATDECEHCGGRFDVTTTAAVPIPSTTLYQCPSCGRWTEQEED